MDVSIIKIGNSKGIRLSKTLLEKYNIKDQVELELERDQIIIKPKNEPRKGCDKAFKEMHENKDDENLMPDIFEDETFDEWN